MNHLVLMQLKLSLPINVSDMPVTSAETADRVQEVTPLRHGILAQGLRRKAKKQGFVVGARYPLQVIPDRPRHNDVGTESMKIQKNLCRKVTCVISREARVDNPHVIPGLLKRTFHEMGKTKILPVIVCEADNNARTAEKSHPN